MSKGSKLALAILVMLAIVGAAIKGKQDEPFAATFVIRNTTLPHEGKEIRNFELRSPTEGAFLVMGDEDLPFIKYLILHQGEKIRITLDTTNLQEVKR